MTLEEANKVAVIISHADGGCLHCVNVLVDLCNVNFPEFTFHFDDEDRVQVKPTKDYKSEH